MSAATYEARLLAHWSLQIPTAVASAMVPEQSDDSHSNFGWSDELGALLSHPLAAVPGLEGVCVGLRLRDLHLVVVRGDALSAETGLHGATLARGLEELRTLLAQVSPSALPESPLREYDMPAHPFAEGAPLELPPASTLAWLHDGFARLSRVFGRVEGDLERHLVDLQGASLAAARLWPHHFDLGGLVTLAGEETRWVGYGWSPGDDAIDAPYVYLNPYPAPETSPPISSELATWHTNSFTGFLIGDRAITGSSDEDLARELTGMTRELIAL